MSHLNSNAADRQTDRQTVDQNHYHRPPFWSVVDNTMIRQAVFILVLLIKRIHTFYCLTKFLQWLKLIHVLLTSSYKFFVSLTETRALYLSQFWSIPFFRLCQLLELPQKDGMPNRMDVFTFGSCTGLNIGLAEHEHMVQEIWTSCCSISRYMENWRRWWTALGPCCPPESPGWQRQY